MNSKEDIRPISYIKANAAEILAQVNETRRPGKRRRYWWILNLMKR